MGVRPPDRGLSNEACNTALVRAHASSLACWRTRTPTRTRGARLRHQRVAPPDTPSRPHPSCQKRGMSCTRDTCRYGVMSSAFPLWRSHGNPRSIDSFSWSFPLQARWLAEGSRRRAPSHGAGAEAVPGRTKTPQAEPRPMPAPQRSTPTVAASHCQQVQARAQSRQPRQPGQPPHRQSSQTSRLRIPLRTQPSASGHDSRPARGTASGPIPLSRTGRAQGVRGREQRPSRPAVIPSTARENRFSGNASAQLVSETRLLKKKLSAGSGADLRSRTPLKPQPSKPRARPAPRPRPEPRRELNPRVGRSTNKQVNAKSRRSDASLMGHGKLVISSEASKPPPVELLVHLLSSSQDLELV